MTRITDQLVCHDKYNSAMHELTHALARARDNDAQIISIVGPTRVGKTKLLDVFIKDQFSSCNGRHEIVKVVSPKHLTGRALPDACLRSIGMNPTMFKNHVAATDTLVKAFLKGGTRLIIFDETQHMLERGTSTSVRAAADFLKDLFDRLQASIVLAGLPTLLGLFEANEQLADRARSPIRYYPYGWEGAEYQSYRSALAGALEFLVESGWETLDYNDADFARRMYVATAGRYGLINKIFMEVQSQHSQRKVALLDEFFEAYECAVMGRFVAFNPFDVDQPIAVEHMALVYAKVLQEAGVSQGGQNAALHS
ncbi:MULTISPECIES: TniB family NTP-binding protein [Pseudomonas]|uniref:TniB family NTP-binding protein n=1 Tax=Pseudomonas TaxID=286 RepID=UPI0030037C2F